MKKRFNISYPSYLKKIRLIIILGFLFDEYLLLKVEENNIANYIIHKFKFFTSWSHMIAFLYFILAILKKETKENKKEKKENKKNDNLSILFQLAFSCQFMVTIVYWVMLHEGVMKKINNPFLIIYCYTSHSLPFLYLLIDFFFNNIIFQNLKTLKTIGIFTTSYLFFLGFLELVYELELYDNITFKS